MSDENENWFASPQFAEHLRWVVWAWIVAGAGALLVSFADYGKVNAFNGSVADLVTELVEIGGDAAFWTFLGTEKNNDLVNHGFLWTQQYLLIGWGEIDDFYVLGWYQEGRKLPQWMFTAYALAAAFYWFWFLWSGFRMKFLEEPLDKDAAERPVFQGSVETLVLWILMLVLPLGTFFLVTYLF